jgi:hypothetical protein
MGYLHAKMLFRRLLMLSGPVAVALVALPGAAAASAGQPCSERFPETEWTSVADGRVSIETTDVAPGLAERFVREIGLIETWVGEEIGFVDVTVCLVDSESAFDVTRYTSGSQRFHARMEMEEQLLVLSTERVGFVGPASAWALAHHGLWQNGEVGPYPEPIASVIGQWYRARILDRLDLYHRDVMVENFFDTESVINWTESEQPPVIDWDPEQNFQAIGDFVDFAVATHGTDVLLESDGDRWSEIEAEWRVALRADLTGRTTPTTEWIVGVSLVVGLLVVASVAVGLGIWSKHRRKQRPETSAAIPRFFSES